MEYISRSRFRFLHDEEMSGAATFFKNAQKNELVLIELKTTPRECLFFNSRTTQSFKTIYQKIIQKLKRF